MGSEGERYELTMADSQKPKQRSNDRIILYLRTSLVLVSIGLIGVVAILIVVVTQVSTAPGNSQNVVVTCTPRHIQERFPGYFKTKKQWQALARAVKAASMNITTENRNVCPNNSSSRFKRDTRTFVEKILKINSVINSLSPTHSGRNVDESRTRRKRRFSSEGDVKFDVLHHACCTSESTYIYPTTGTTIEGAEVEIVQSDELQQSFLTQSCESNPDCDLCECEQPEPFVAKGVIFKDKGSMNITERYGVADLAFPGCCKCLNIE